MRLGSSIIGGKPMRIPGIVDVYQVGNEWVARSWPRPANQPNSAAQLLWRQKFTAAKAEIATWSGIYLEAWKKIECPPGKMWIDIAMTSILRSTGSFAFNKSSAGAIWALYYSPTGFPLYNYKFALFMNAAAYMFSYHNYAFGYQDARTFSAVMKWSDLGFICAKGKRPKIKWTLNRCGTPLQIIGLWFEGEWPYGIVSMPFESLSNGLAMSGLWRMAPSETTPINYCLHYPPVFFKQQPWPGHFP